MYFLKIILKIFLKLFLVVGSNIETSFSVNANLNQRSFGFCRRKNNLGQAV